MDERVHYNEGHGNLQGMSSGLSGDVWQWACKPFISDLRSLSILESIRLAPSTAGRARSHSQAKSSTPKKVQNVPIFSSHDSRFPIPNSQTHASPLDLSRVVFPSPVTPQENSHPPSTSASALPHCPPPPQQECSILSHQSY